MVNYSGGPRSEIESLLGGDNPVGGNPFEEGQVMLEKCGPLVAPPAPEGPGPVPPVQSSNSVRRLRGLDRVFAAKKQQQLAASKSFFSWRANNLDPDDRQLTRALAASGRIPGPRALTASSSPNSLLRA